MIKKSMYALLLGGLLLATTSRAMAAEKLYQGLGQTSNFRIGPGKDSQGVPVYSLNYVTDAGIFDDKARIVNLIVDILELSSPNYDGATMPHFSGWPGQAGYNDVADYKSGEISGISKNTVESATAEVSEWKTKRERGIDYGMNPKNDWDKQMDFFQNFFKGKTVEEVEAWFAKYTSDVNGRPLKPDSKHEKDREKFAKLSDVEKKELTDIAAGATMSVRDSHGDILGAIKEAYENRVEVK